ncbi:SasC/FmtB family protein [Staphylococcus warneri]|uniref:SasC/FmtB family protein n=1 Tax=Staphylococcus warneri TaxID=1292 RepID=UPI00030D957C|nr:SasC/FmtB family protein [Staphylococcus warneri]
MNLFRKETFSIRKFKVGIFSTLIATVAFWSSTHTHLAQADETNSQPVDDVQKLQEITSNGQLDNKEELKNNQETISETGVSDVSNQVNPNNDSVNTNNQQTQIDINENTNSSIIKETQSSNNESTTMIEGASPIKTDDTVNHVKPVSEQMSVKPKQQAEEKIQNMNAVMEPATKPKKRHRRDVSNTPTVAGGTGPQNGTPQNTNGEFSIDDATIDPNINNIGNNTLNYRFTFEDVGVKPSENRNNPQVIVLNSLPGFNLIDGGKVGVLNAVLERTQVFHPGDRNNKQAQGTVLALGRVEGNDPNNHGDFNGIEKEVTVNPNSEIIFDFNTMAAGNGKGGTNLVIKDANTNTVIGNGDIQAGDMLRLFKVPDNVSNIKIQLIPNNDIMGNVRRLEKNQDGYRYYDFIDNVGIRSGSHLYISGRNKENNVKNNTNFTVTTQVTNNGKSGASMLPGAFEYSMQLPEGIEYVPNSITTSFPDGNGPNDVMNPLTENYDQGTRTLTFTSNGITSATPTQGEPTSLLANKTLNVTFNLRVKNVANPKQVTFSDAIKSKTYTQTYLNGEPPQSTVNGVPYQVNIVMNKDDLQAQYNWGVVPSDYTYASYQEYNRLKQQALTILNEDRNHVPLNQQVSQATIDNLLHQMQHTLISRVDAARELGQKADDRSDEVDTVNDLTDDENDAYRGQITNLKNDALNHIDDQTTDDGVTREKEAGINKINQVNIVPVIKPNARQAINDKANEQRQRIQQDPVATKEEKEAANAQVDNHVATAMNNINQAHTNDAVNDAKNNGMNEINSDVPANTYRANAIAAINQAVVKQREQINQNQEATQEERDNALNELNQASEQAIQNIKQGISNSDVDDAKNKGIDAILDIAPVTIVKQAAREAIANNAQQKIADINTNHEATLEEREAAIQLVNQAVTSANDNILKANTNNDVDVVKNNALNQIQAITPATIVKTNAKNALNQKAQEQHNIIFSNNEATVEEQQAAQLILDQALNTAIKNIDNADTNQQVTDAKNNGLQEIGNVQPSTQVKTDARNAVTNKANEAITNINATPGATREEKQEAVDRVNNLLNRALNDINTVNTTPMVEAIKNTALNDIGNVQPNVTKKQEAIGILNNNAATKKQNINQTPDATTEEKEAAITEVNQALNQAIEQVNQADTNAQVDQAQQNGDHNINQIQTHVVKKPEALNIVTQQYNNKLAQINQTPDATIEEKNTAIQQLNQNKQQALEALNQAQTNQEVDQVKDQAIQNIDAIQVNVVTKPDARQALIDAKTDQERVINSTQDATVEEKNAALQKLEQIFNQANASINQAQTNQKVEDVRQQAIDQINTTLPETIVKNNARNNIETEAKQRDNVIDNNVESTVEEKDAAKQLVDQAKNQALQNIAQAQTNQEVNNAVANGNQEIQQIVPETIVKTTARQTLLNAINNKKQEAIDNKEATQDEKDMFINNLNNELNDLNKQITADNTNQEVATTKDNGLENINQIVFKPTVKQNARDAIQKLVDHQQDLINQANDATNEEKNSALDRLQNAANQLLTDINNATTNAQVNQIQTKSDALIPNILPHIVVKENARTMINQTVGNQDKIINGVEDATVEEKDTATNDVNIVANKAKNDINRLTDDTEVENTKNKAINDIEQILPSTKVKTDARDSLNQTSELKLNDLSLTPDATNEEINVAKALVEQLLNQALTQINQDKTTNQVNLTEQQGVKAINDVQVNVVKKNEARTAITNVEDNKSQLFNNNDEATTEEKEIALQQLKAAVNQYTNEVSSAHTNQNVADVLSKALKEIEQIMPNIEVKPAAIEALKQLSSQIKTQINETNEATLEEKDEAINQLEEALKNSIDTVDQSLTNAEVAKAKLEWETLIKSIKPLIKVKPEANEALTSIAQQVIQDFERISEATQEEKDQAIAKVHKELEIAKILVLKALTNEEVAQVKLKEVQLIEHIQPVIEVKPTAKDDINLVANEIKEKINQLKNVNPIAIKNALDRIENILNEANMLIKDAKTNAEVAQIVKETIEKLKAIQLPTEEMQVEKTIEKAKEPVLVCVTSDNTIVIEKEIKDSCILKEEATQMLPNSGVTNYQHPIVPIMFTFGIAIFASSLKRRKKDN